MYKNGELYEQFLYTGADKISFDAIKHDIEFYESDLDLNKWKNDD